MFAFLSLGTQITSRWLNAEQVAGQAQRNISVQKRELRKILQDSRAKLKQDTLAEGAPWGAGHLAQLALFLDGKGLLPREADLHPVHLTLATYWPINSELALIPSAGQLQSSAVRWLLPKISKDGQLDWFDLIEDIGTWPKDKLGLPVPPATTLTHDFAATAPAPWIVLTPCLAADHSGYRLGYGGGYYDRFISHWGHRCLLAACVPQQLFFQNSDLPHEDHDQKVDLVITENEVWITNDKTLRDKIKLFS
jgi:5-formyltetrahydrofolate cyclo-ligase